ncbi:MAG: hypothetical protein EZS28_030731, partial [Streblomastix strix]
LQKQMFIAQFRELLMKVLVLGDARITENELIPTIWKVQRYYEQIISVQDSNITVNNIAFQFTVVYSNGNLVVSPSYAIIFISNNNSNLTVKNCIFKGFGINRTEIGSFANSYMSNKLEFDNCSFSDMVGRNALDIHSCTQFSVRNCKFTDIVGAIFITFYEESQAPIIKINNNFFKDCLGFSTGGIYLSYVTAYILEIQNNTFEGNRIQSSNTHTDAYIYKRGNDTLLPNALEYTKTVFLVSVSSQSNSVYNNYYYLYNSSYFSMDVLVSPSFYRKFINQNGTQDFTSISAALGTGNPQHELEARIVGLIHSEQVIIGENKGWKRNRITIIGDGNRTRQRVTLSGGNENEGENQYIIEIENTVIGDIMIQNIEMQKWQGGFLKADGGKSVALRECSFFGGGTIVHNSPGKLEITLCDFVGNSQLSIINSFINATQGTVDISCSTFYQGSFTGQGNGCVVCSQQCTACMIDGCQFIRNILGAGSSAIAITTQNCLLLSIQGNPFSRTVFSYFGVNDPIKGHFIISQSKKIYISYSDFTDTSFSCSGNAIRINEQFSSEITLLKCNFTGLRGINNRRSICLQAQLSSVNGFKFICRNCTFSDCSFSGVQHAIGNAISVTSPESQVQEINREIQFQDCEIRRNTGSGFGGSIGLDIRAQCIFSLKSNYFAENLGSKSNDIWISTVNSVDELNETNFATFYSNSIQPHIMIERNDSTSNIYNFINIQIELYVSSSGSSNNDGTKAKPFNNITYAINRLTYYELQSQSQSFEGTIYILNSTWSERVTIDSKQYNLTIKSGLELGQDGDIIKTIWRQNSSQYYVIEAKWVKFKSSQLYAMHECYSIQSDKQHI